MATVGTAKSVLVDKINSLTSSATPKDTIFLAKALGEATSLTNFVWKGAWATGTEYAIDDVVREGNDSYVCVSAHTAGATFSGDSAKWELMAQGSEVPDQSGNSGNFLTTDGSSLSWASASAGLKSQQVFTSSGTWTKPAGINLIKVYVTGGGAGGGSGTGSYNVGGGGGAGGTSIEIIDVSSVTSVSVTVGSAGAGVGSGNAGGNGGTSSFGSYCTASGGIGGYPGNSVDAPLQGKGGIGSGGDINIRGGAGEHHGAHSTGDSSGGGHGGSSYWGGGGSSANYWTATGPKGGTDVAFGAGGGGGNHTGSIQSGAGGNNGIVIVEEYA